jgi:hypothetical protein
MNTLNVPHVDSPPPGLASWYTPGRSDGFGDRLLMFDNTDAVSLELLRFRRELAVSNGFENGLRDRVDQLSHFHHPAFAPVRAVVHLDGQDLTLVSAHTAGQRLSELPVAKFRKGLHPAVVTWIVREITPALAAMQSTGPHVAHGAINADRIVLTAEGRLCLTELPLGWAIRRLALTPAVFWRQFGLLAPVDDRGRVRIDPRTDVVQLGTIALSLLLGRQVTLNEFERGLPTLLDEFTASAATSPSVFAAPLRAWLERALQLAPRSYRSAADAQEALQELPAGAGPGSTVAATLQLPGARGESEDARQLAMSEIVSMSRRDARGPLRPQLVREVPRERDPIPAPLPATPIADAPVVPAERPRWKRSHSIWIAAALGVVALIEGAVIATLGTQPAVVSLPAPAVSAPSQSALIPAPPRTAAVVPAIEPANNPAPDAASAAIALAAARQKSGGVRVSSAIDLNVFEGERVLGSTADGPIVMTAGTHDVELVNAALGYRVRQTITVRAGVITPMTVTAPTGRININAQPWAQVLIDDNPVGDTPLANVSVPLGQHQITFRHPQLGERRQTVTVRADSVTRVSVTF